MKGLVTAKELEEISKLKEDFDSLMYEVFMRYHAFNLQGKIDPEIAWEIKSELEDKIREDFFTSKYIEYSEYLNSARAAGIGEYFEGLLYLRVSKISGWSGFPSFALNPYSNFFKGKHSELRNADIKPIKKIDYKKIIEDAIKLYKRDEKRKFERGYYEYQEACRAQHLDFKEFCEFLSRLYRHKDRSSGRHGYGRYDYEHDRPDVAQDRRLYYYKRMQIKTMKKRFEKGFELFLEYMHYENLAGLEGIKERYLDNLDFGSITKFNPKEAYDYAYNRKIKQLQAENRIEVEDVMEALP